MKTGDALLALVIIAVVGLGMFVWGEVFRPKYEYFLFGEGGGSWIMRVNVVTGIPEWMMADRTTGAWCYQISSPGDAPPDSTRLSRRVGGVYSD
jgi:hypothetical protein